MARKDASLELRKARSTTGQLELNQAEVVRYEAILVGASMPPRLAVSPDLLTLPASWVSQPDLPIAALGGAVVLEGSLASTTAPDCAMVGAFVIECGMVASNQQPVPVIAGEYDINVFRGPSAAQESQWERAGLVSSRVDSSWERPELARTVGAVSWQEAEPASSEQVEQSAIMPQRYELARSQYQEGLVTGHDHGQQVEHLAPGHAVNRALWVEGDKAGMWQVGGYRNPPRFDQVWQADQWSQGDAVGLLLYGRRTRLGLPLWKGWRDGWEEAMQPGPGTSPDPKPPIIPERPDKRTLRLEFGRKRGEAELEFVWHGSDAAIVIPTRRVYLVSNTAKIVRVRDGLDIPATAVSIELDTDSWAWQFSAQIPRIAAAALTDEEEVSIHINGQQWDCVCDGWQSSQSFGRESATLTGRSRTAYLSPTHVLAQAVSEPAAATMAQLAAAVLPVGWTLDWQAADWLVPAGFFSLDNQTPIEVVRYLAEAAGGFVLPHQRNRHLVIKPRYPTVPWQLDTAVADVAIPRAIITTLGSDFQPGHAANGIWVSGGHQGISARVVRQGTAGEQQAPTITHPLVCDVTAARAQGVVGLAKTMPKRTQTIELPLSADTGLILPGALLAVDGWKGYNRGVRVSAALQNRAMTVRQQLSVERFV
ncbi:hypothetical protein LOS88_15325 [Aeromonas veronii]|uniref:hypothetical protein n=1 Tax=Aeromonas veronii TaxID=654 RepID=UPI001FD5B6E2|nr:hypothetical protein [Aeromonas veronii]MCJ7975603.1 hypothetical protein [Aeromonas veronii]UOR17581.1 hypothetical protein LOS88_15325 [Aeromonas veronii]